MSALRLARGATGRPKIVKFEGCYHGHSDGLLVKAGSGAATCGVPTSAGVTEGTAADTIVARYNDIEGIARLLGHEGKLIAAVIVEPVAGNMGCIPPARGFLESLRELTKQSGALLIFDEVMTGFRLARGGAQELYGIGPDISCFGKVVGGGLPVGAYGGPKSLMENISPMGPVYQAGTLSGNPLAMTAGIKTLELLSKPGVYDDLDAKTKKLCLGIAKALDDRSIPYCINRVGSMWSLFFSSGDVTDFATATRGDADRFRKFFHHMLDGGVYLAPSAYESAFMSLAHTDGDIDRTIDVVQRWAQGEAKG